MMDTERPCLVMSIILPAQRLPKFSSAAMTHIWKHLIALSPKRAILALLMQMLSEADNHLY